MEVIIAGAGIGGLALARGLAADGHRVRVFERATARRTDGAAVTVFSNGAAAAAGLGITLDGLGSTIETLEFCTPDGRPFARADLREMRRRTGFGVATVPRPVLLDRLAAGLDGGVVEYGRRVVGVVPEPGGAVVTDAAGVRHRADLVVGADGHRSAVRAAVLDDRPAARTGWTSWQGLTATVPDLASGTQARCVVGTAGLCGLMPAGGGLLQWWFDTPVPAPAGRSIVDWLRVRFAGYSGPVAELLADLDESDVQEFPHVVHRVPARWGSGASTLVGDAAHAFPPSQAQGANQALEDGWLLRRALAGAGDLPARLRRYERVRTRQVRRVSRLAASEITNRPPGLLSRLLGRALTPQQLARLHLAVLRRCGGVLRAGRP